MKKHIISTAIALTLATPALASGQFERALGVEPGAFTTAQLIDLTRAYEENDQNRINFILSGGSNLDAAEIERRGLEEAIARAEEEGDFLQVENLRDQLGQPSDSVVSSRGVTELPANLQQVVERLDITASDFTISDLIALERSLEEGDLVAVNGLISRVRG